MRIGVLTGGGDCPGLNAVIRAAVRKGVKEYGHEFVGFRDGWRGPLEGITQPLGCDRSGHPAARRHDPRLLAHQPVQDRRRRRGDQEEHGRAGRRRAHRDRRRGHPRRRDEADRPTASLSSACRRRSTTTSRRTDYTFGFDTAVNIATEAIDRLHTTAESHDRCIVVEVMGRHAGWIALHAGIAGGANVILRSRASPSTSRRSRATSRSATRPARPPIVVVAEGAHAQGGRHGRCRTARSTRSATSSSAASASGSPRRSRSATGKETRAVVLGHLQRGGTPTAFDRVLATRFGLQARPRPSRRATSAR